MKWTEKAGLLRKHASLFPEHFVHSIRLHHRLGRCSYEDSKSFLSKWNIFSQASFPQLFIIWTRWRCDGSVGKTTSFWSDVYVCECELGVCEGEGENVRRRGGGGGVQVVYWVEGVCSVLRRRVDENGKSLLIIDVIEQLFLLSCWKW